LVASPDQYAFITSGIKISYDKPIAPNPWVLWITGQEPVTGETGSGAEVLLNVSPFFHNIPPR
jgi:hypothetical protein